MTSLRGEDLVHALPYGRRYARALTGSQTAGDALVAACLRTGLQSGARSGPQSEPQSELKSGQTIASQDPRLVLYDWITRAFAAANEARATSQTDGLALAQRQLLLLTALEELALEDAATVVGLPVAEASRMLAEARDMLRAAAAADVLIIEDEPIIAMDIEELVQACGHRVVGVASSEQQAVDIARRMQPGLILADINLGKGGDGTKAVARILQSLQAPVIFVTAYPERLLTGVDEEPAFVITKPFEPMTLAIATYQAVTGGVRLG